MKPMHREHITFVKEPFTPHDLLQLVKTVKEIDCKAFTVAVAESLRAINNPPVIIGSDMNINLSKGGN